MEGQSRIKRVSLGLGLGAALMASIAGPAFAADTVTQVVNGGTRSASAADLALPAASYSHSDQTKSGTMTLTADDSSGTGLGWNVTIQSSAFVYSGSNTGSNIPAVNFELTSAADPTRTAGQAVDALGGPKVPLVSPVGSLDSARKTVHAVVGYGQGTYTQALGVRLTIPAQSKAGTYTGTLTTTITAGP